MVLDLLDVVGSVGGELPHSPPNYQHEDDLAQDEWSGQMPAAADPAADRPLVGRIGRRQSAYRSAGSGCLCSRIVGRSSLRPSSVTSTHEIKSESESPKGFPF